MTLRVDGEEGERVDYWIWDQGQIIAHGFATSFATVLEVFAMHQRLRA